MLRFIFLIKEHYWNFVQFLYNITKMHETYDTLDSMLAEPAWDGGSMAVFAR